MSATNFNRRTIDEFRSKGGKGIGGWGDNLLLMTSKGRHSGRSITTPLVYRRRDGRLVVVASLAGAPSNPHWFTNIQADPIVEIEVASTGDEGIETLTARAKVIARGPERDELYAFMTEVWPQFAEYSRRTARVIPVVILEPIGAERRSG